MGYAGFRTGGLIAGAILGQFISSIWLAIKLVRKYAEFISQMSWNKMFAQAKRFSNFPKFECCMLLQIIFQGIYLFLFSQVISVLLSRATGLLPLVLCISQ